MAPTVTAAKIFMEGMTAVITGASSGIGRATAMTLASKGMNVWIVDIDKEELDAARELVMGKCLNKDAQVSSITRVQPNAAIRFLHLSFLYRKLRPA